MIIIKQFVPIITYLNTNAKIISVFHRLIHILSANSVDYCIQRMLLSAMTSLACSFLNSLKNDKAAVPTLQAKATDDVPDTDIDILNIPPMEKQHAAATVSYYFASL